jgi:uncharacterized OB-fold protein
MSLPNPTISPSPDAAPFWEAARRHELALPWCTACEAFFFYPRTHCPACGSRAIEWRAASGRGRVYTFCIHYHSALPGFGDAVPFVTAIVELEEGPRLMTFLTDVAPEPGAISCGMPVEVDFVDREDGTVLPVFRPAGAAS